MGYYHDVYHLNALDTLKRDSGLGSPKSHSGRTNDAHKYNGNTTDIWLDNLSRSVVALPNTSIEVAPNIIGDGYKTPILAHGVQVKAIYPYLKEVAVVNNNGGVEYKPAQVGVTYETPDGKLHVLKSANDTHVTTIKTSYQESAGSLNGVNLSLIINGIDKSFGIQTPLDTFKKSIKQQMTKYNRFKVPELNLHMTKCFGHVFFTRPSCNILDSNRNLVSTVANNPNFLYARSTCPGLLEELTKYGPSGCGNDFNMLLSNTSKGFALNDETLQTGTHGTTFSGYKISYGKDDVESKTAGEFSTTFIDDKRVHAYRLHKLWVEYIAGVYRGRFTPTVSNELNKIIDYASSVYYILTAEDGETIIFWTKYFGVYPITIPSSQYSWQHGETLSPNEIQVTYAYSWKQDFDPRDLISFNYNARLNTGNYSFTRTFDTELLMPGPTWVGTPFIEFIDDGINEPCYKLRFTE